MKNTLLHNVISDRHFLSAISAFCLFLIGGISSEASGLQSSQGTSTGINASAPQSSGLMANVYGRSYQSLNGKWDAIVDLYDQGDRMEVYKNKKAASNEEFYEYSFQGGLRLNVPGDWNSQSPELKYYEGTVWYARHFESSKEPGKRKFLYFAAVSYRSEIYLNGEKIHEHEGGFTPFQVEITDIMKDGDNFLVVRVNNRRTVDAIPALAFDWWNYGGITRDVMLVSVPDIFIEDYFIYLDKNDPQLIHASVKLSSPGLYGLERESSEKEGTVTGARNPEVLLEIPGLKISKTLRFDGNCLAETTVKAKHLKRWSPDSPVLYSVRLSSAMDTICEEIGFRNISVNGTDILVNGKQTFMRGVSFHEEIPQRLGRAFSESDAIMLLSEAKALGVNLIRLAHYPQNEYIVRMAEKMGIILWQEIPVWQGIDFGNKETLQKASGMLLEMISRDKNRCAVGFWGVANETKPSPERNSFLETLLSAGRSVDTTRLYVAAFDIAYWQEKSGCFEMHDDFIHNLDVVAVNKYMGWYAPWPVDPAQARWNVAEGKPLIISEFGGEALYGQHGDENQASSWSEEYQAKLYRDNLRMFENIPNLAGISPWVLFDFRSPFRFHPANQDGWNRKGLVSDRGYRKQAWYIMRDYYLKKTED